MSDITDDVSLPPLIRVHFASNLQRIARATGLSQLDLAIERAEGFVEGVEAARALNVTTIEALFLAVEQVGLTRRQALVHGSSTASPTEISLAFRMVWGWFICRLRFALVLPLFWHKCSLLNTRTRCS